MAAASQHPPSVDRLARSLSTSGLPHPMLVRVAREAIESGDPESASDRARDASRRLLTPVINGTGVLLHTNLGRAPMGYEQPEQYTNLELDLVSGQRGSRMATAPALLAEACGAEAALVVNNCAAAVLLVLAALADERDVVVSRGELVEIGGGFRVPDVMQRSGARLVEVGTTNRTRRSDYQAAVDANDVALVMQVHQSNYRIVGFTEAPTTSELASLGLPLIADIGSGLLDSRCPWLVGGPPGWLDREPAARQTLDAGAAVVTFSGDKLLGGPQAGIIAGRGDLIEACAAHPLARALRPGALVLGALQQTALAYLRGDGDAIGFWRMAALGVDELKQRAADCVSGRVEVVDTVATPGGGTLPGVEIASAGIAIDGDHRDALRGLERPVISRVVEGKTVVDLRTVHPDDDAEVGEALTAVSG